MFNDDNGRRKFAKSITHYVYRETRREEYHGAGGKMDKNFYRAMYDTVSRKLNTVRLFQRYLDEFPQEFLTDKAVFDKLIKTIPEDLKFRFMRYSQCIIDGLKLGVNWDEAQRVDGIKDGQSCANYVLGGAFSECCSNGCILDDRTMCIINKDVHNRIYTLLVDGCFDR